MTVRITLQDIADRCGVSKMSVSQILRHPENPRYSLKTRQAVLAVADEFGYIRNRQAESLRTGLTGLTGLLLPWNIPELMDATARRMAAVNRALLVQFLPSPNAANEEQAMRLLIEHRIDTLIWMPATSVSAAQAALLERQKIRVILLEIPGPDEAGFPLIDCDYRQGFASGLRHAAQAGYRRVLFLHPLAMPQRVALAEAAARENQLEFSARRVESTSAVRKLLRDAPPDTLVLCENDWLGLEVSASGAAVGVMILGDLLIGNRYRIGEIHRVPLTALQRDFTAMAEAAVRLATEPQPASGSPIRIPMKLVVRQSTPPVETGGNTGIHPEKSNS